MSTPRVSRFGWLPTLLFGFSLFLLLESEWVMSWFEVDGQRQLQVWKRGFESMAWLSGAALLNQLLRRLLWDGLVTRALGTPVPGVLRAIVGVLVYIAALACIVGLVYGRSVTAFMAALGASGVVVGFALRDLLADVFTGLAINIDRTFGIGDWVQVNGGHDGSTVARIREIGWRSTILTTEEQTTVVMPNGMLGRERVINISQPIEPTRYEVSVTVEYAVSPDRVRRVLTAALTALQLEPGFVQDREPAMLIGDVSSLGVEYRLRYWILPWHPLSPSVARSRVLSTALRYLHVAGISLAYPKSDVYHAALLPRQVEGHGRADELKLLAKLPLFEPLNDEDLERVVASLSRRKLAAGETLVRAGDDGSSLFVLIEGLLDVFVERDGEERRVGRIEPGSCLGEISLLTGEKRSATVRCVTDSVIYEIGGEPLQVSMERRPELASRLARILAERQLLTQHALAERSSETDPAAFDSFARQLLARMRDYLAQARSRAS